MIRSLRSSLLALAAGAVSATLTGLLMWAADTVGLTRSVGVDLTEALANRGIYAHIVWGGIWGLLLLLPVIKSQIFLRGVTFSLAPTLAQLLFFAPASGHGLFAFGLGILAPAFIVLFNVIWGICAAYLYKMTR